MNRHVSSLTVAISLIAAGGLSACGADDFGTSPFESLSGANGEPQSEPQSDAGSGASPNAEDELTIDFGPRDRPVADDVEFANCGGVDTGILDRVVNAADSLQEGILGLIPVGQSHIVFADSQLGTLLVESELVVRDADWRDLLATYYGGHRQLVEASRTGLYELRDQDDGAWASVVLVDPATDRRVLADPFEMSSYFDGLEITSSLTIDEMADDPRAVARFNFTYDDLGPLGHLLEIDDSAAREFSIDASLDELGQLYHGVMFPEIEVLEPAGGLLMRSFVRLTAQDDDVRVLVDARVDERTLRDVRTNSAIEFSIEGGFVERDELVLHVVPGTLVVRQNGSLQGEFQATLADGARSIVMTTSFGSGSPDTAKRTVTCGVAEPEIAPAYRCPATL